MAEKRVSVRLVAEGGRQVRAGAEPGEQGGPGQALGDVDAAGVLVVHGSPV